MFVDVKKLRSTIPDLVGEEILITPLVSTR